MINKIFTLSLSLLILSSLHAQNDSIPGNPFADTLIIAVDTAIAIDIATPVDYNKSPAKQPIYKIKAGIDVPLTAAASAWSLYAFTKIYSKPHSSEEKILSLQKSDINGFDRWAVRPFSKSIDRISYYPFFAVMPMPFIFLTGKSTRKDFFKLTFLYLETMSITGLLYTGSVYYSNRYRPYAYTSESTMDQRTRGGAKNSFYAGHVALIATSSFFAAKVYADYHPDSKIRWLFYTLAGTATATVTYLRYRAGQHFPSDLLLGITQGTLTGILVPHFHKHRLIKDTNLSLTPFSNGKQQGLALVYKL
jgi:membrane-associated phospholipid phosphatase